MNKLFHVKRYGYDYPLHSFNSVSRFNKPIYSGVRFYGMFDYTSTIEEGNRLIMNFNSLPFLSRFDKNVVNTFVDKNNSRFRLLDNLKKVDNMLNDLIENQDFVGIIGILKNIDERKQRGLSKNIKYSVNAYNIIRINELKSELCSTIHILEKVNKYFIF